MNWQSEDTFVGWPLWLWAQKTQVVGHLCRTARLQNRLVTGEPSSPLGKGRLDHSNCKILSGDDLGKVQLKLVNL